MNRIRLEYELRSRGITVEQACEATGMSTGAWYRRLRGETEFTQGEIQALMDLMHLDSPMGIFFDDKGFLNETR